VVYRRPALKHIVLERNSTSSVSAHKLPLAAHAQLAHVGVGDRKPVAAQVKFADSWVLHMAGAGSAVTYVGTGPGHLESVAASAEFVDDPASSHLGDGLRGSTERIWAAVTWGDQRRSLELSESEVANSS
jgi:hypothetical protein